MDFAMNLLQQSLRPALSLFVLLTAVTGIAYPLATTVIAQAVFAEAANGSLVVVGARTVGSTLIGQAFTQPGHFWSRPSATAPMANNGVASGGSNLGSNNPALLNAVKSRIAALRAADPGNSAPIPVDLVTASGSGLDPDISLAAAFYQAPRIARERHVDLSVVQALIEKHAARPFLGVIGEPRVNVLALNLAIDALGRRR
jgi:K+-transporting ATPase ATPase C chain